MDFPKWEEDGFAIEPAEWTARGDEIVLRAYTAKIDRAHDFKSTREGQFFFVPRMAVHEASLGGFTIERDRWTGPFLARHLNAFVFGNAFERLGVWALNPGTRFRIGPIGFDTRTTVPVRLRETAGQVGGKTLYRHTIAQPEGGGPFFQLQILFEKSDAGSWLVERAMRQIDDLSIVLPITTFVSDDGVRPNRH